MIYGSLQQRMIALATLITLATAAQNKEINIGYTGKQEIKIAVTNKDAEIVSFDKIKLSSVCIKKNQIEKHPVGFQENGKTYMCEIILNLEDRISDVDVVKFKDIKDWKNEHRKKYLYLACSIPLPKGSTTYKYDGRDLNAFKKVCLPRQMRQCIGKTSIDIGVKSTAGLFATGDRCTIGVNTNRNKITLKFKRFEKKGAEDVKPVVVPEPVKEDETGDDTGDEAGDDTDETSDLSGDETSDLSGGETSDLSGGETSNVSGGGDGGWSDYSDSDCDEHTKKITPKPKKSYKLRKQEYYARVGGPEDIERIQKIIDEEKRLKQKLVVQEKLHPGADKTISKDNSMQRLVTEEVRTEVRTKGTEVNWDTDKCPWCGKEKCGHYTVYLKESMIKMAAERKELLKRMKAKRMAKRM